MKNEFKVGDAVYYCDGHEIGIITHVPGEQFTAYRVEYCQDKDLETGPRGGNGPILNEGYPQPVTEPDDVLFVLILEHQAEGQRHAAMSTAYKQNVESLRLARNIVIGKQRAGGIKET